MESDTLARLKQLDFSVLAEIVRADQDDAAYEVLDWAVQPLGHTKIIDTTGGLYHFSGHGRNDSEVTPWSVVLKILTKSTEGECLDADAWCYWKRELLVFQSDLPGKLPPVVHIPRCFGVTEYEDSGWIWLEHIADVTPRQWSLDQYRRAAHAFGRFGGAFLIGTPLPAASWLCAPFFRTVFADQSWWATHMDAETEETVWRSPIVQQGFPEPLRAQILRIWADKNTFCDVLDRLPRVFCHGDLHRRNLMIRSTADGQSELVAVDWAFSGLGAIGEDAGKLIFSSLFFCDADMKMVADLDVSGFNGYLAGLREAGWAGDARLARLGYLLSAVLWTGGTLPGWAATMIGEASTDYLLALYGRSPEDLLADWVSLTRFLLERADEARHLIGVLGMA